MNLTIQPLTAELIPAYLDFFDNRAFSATDVNGPCYCTCPTQTSEEIDRMVSEFAGDIKGTLRKHAAKMLAEGKIRGYLAFDGETAVGWCNAAMKNTYVKKIRYQFFPDFAWVRRSDRRNVGRCFLDCARLPRQRRFDRAVDEGR
jgi:hypothetical protein